MYVGMHNLSTRHVGVAGFRNIVREQLCQIRQGIVNIGVALQVYLGKWQETDVAVKVLTEMQNLSSHEGVHPQDPSDMGSWRGGGPPPCQGGNKANHAAGLRVINGDSDSHGWGSDDGSSIGADSEVVPSEERQEALRTLEREVCPSSCCSIAPLRVSCFCLFLQSVLWSVKGLEEL